MWGARQRGRQRPPKDDLAVVALTSTNGVPATNTGAPPEWFYDYNITAGQSISDTVCVNFTLTDKNGTADSRTVSFNVAGDPAISVTPNSATVTVSDAPVGGAGATQQDCFAIVVAAGAVTTDAATQIQVNVDPASDGRFVQLSHDTIHIHIHVIPASSISCFVTDSSFNFLLDCGNVPVTSGNGGRFTIQVNKKNIEVSTQPGQFYYNALWTNGSGGDLTVRVVFVRSGVNPHGAQAIHASVFPSFPALTSFNFAVVNDDIPSGADDTLDGVLVPAGDTLWTDYHLEWAGLGGLAPTNLATTCATANQPWSVSATVYDTKGTADTSDDTVLAGPCTAGAIGYKH